MIFAKATITYFWLKSKFHLKEVPVMTNNSLTLYHILAFIIYENNDLNFVGNIFVLMKNKSNNYYDVMKFQRLI